MGSPSPWTTDQACGREHDWDHRGRLFCAEDGWGGTRKYEVDLEPDEIGRKIGKTLGISVGPTIAGLGRGPQSRAIEYRRGPWCGCCEAPNVDRDDRIPPVPAELAWLANWT